MATEYYDAFLKDPTTITPKQATIILDDLFFDNTRDPDDSNYLTESDILDEFEDHDDVIQLAALGGVPTKMTTILKYKEELDELVLLRQFQIDVARVMCFSKKLVTEKLYRVEYETLERLEKRQRKIQEFLTALQWYSVRQWVIQQNISLPELCQRLSIPFRCHNYSYIYGCAQPLGTFGTDFKNAILKWHQQPGELPEPKYKNDPAAVEFLETNKALFIRLGEFNQDYHIDLKHPPTASFVMYTNGDYKRFCDVIQRYFVATATYTKCEPSNPWERVLE
jgi:hypothetical protein